MKTTMLRTLIMIASMSLPAAARAAEPVAFVTNLKGDVSVDGGSRPLLMSELAKGQKLAVGKDATLAVMYIQSGKEFVLKGPGDFTVGDREVATSGIGVAPASRDTAWRASSEVLVKVAQTQSASIRMRSIAPGKAVSPPLVFPVRGAVSSLQPTLRWTTPDPQALAEIFVAVAGAEDKPAIKAKSTGAAFKIPSRLKPDTEYAWRVVVAGVELGKATFRTLPAASIDKVDKRRPGDKAEFSDRLNFALLLQDLGATQEAGEQWARLAQERDDLPEIAALAK